MPRLKLNRFRAVPPPPDVLAAYVVAYESRDLVRAPEAQPPLTAQRLFGRDVPLVVDLGCGRGDFLIAQAQERPAEYFVGFDWHWKSLWDAVNKAHRAGLDNLRFVRADFRLVLPKVPDECVSELFVLFPPPVLKANKLAQDPLPAATLREMGRVLRGGAPFHFVTDQPEYFEVKRALIERSGLFTPPIMMHPAPGSLTRYQRFWERFGIEAMGLVCRKND